jgi:hypothetical protein
MGAQRSGSTVEFQGGGGPPAIDGGFPVFLQHGEEEGELRLQGVDTVIVSGWGSPEGEARQRWRL